MIRVQNGWDHLSTRRDVWTRPGAGSGPGARRIVPKTETDLFDRIVSFPALRAARAKRAKPGAAAFLANLEKEILRLERELCSGRCQPGRYRRSRRPHGESGVVCERSGAVMMRKDTHLSCPPLRGGVWVCAKGGRFS